MWCFHSESTHLYTKFLSENDAEKIKSCLTGNGFSMTETNDLKKAVNLYENCFILNVFMTDELREWYQKGSGLIGMWCYN